MKPPRERGTQRVDAVGGLHRSNEDLGESHESDVGGLRDRAGRAALLVTVRGLLIKLTSFVGTIVLARLLAPEDFGLIALGLVLTSLGGVLADAGLGPALIQREEAPRLKELRSVLGYGLAIAAVVVVVGGVLALVAGRLGFVCFLMTWSVPFSALRSPAIITSERALDYRPVLLGEVGEVVAYNVWAVAGVALGFGVWALASAAPFRAIVGSYLITRAAGVPVLAPALEWAPLRPLLGFGLRYQAVSLVGLARDQGLNAGTAALAGVSTLGVWSIAFRILSVPYLLLEALWRVSFPAMARLAAITHSLGPALERAAGRTAVMLIAFLAPLAASSDSLIPALLGSQWAEASAAIVPACAGLAIAGPISVASAGYLFAVGEAGLVLRAVALYATVWLVVAFSLLAFLGVAALGVGWLLGGIAEALVLGASARARTGARFFWVILPPLLSGLLAGVTGAYVRGVPSSDWIGAGAGAAVCVVAYVVVLGVIAPQALSDSVSFSRALLRRSQ